MNNKDQLIFNGKKIEKTFFIDEPQYNSYLIVWRMQSIFKFNIIGQGAKGRVKIDFCFHEYSKDRSFKAPLEINIASALDLENSNNFTLHQKEKIKKQLLTMFEVLKEDIFTKHFNTISII